jgi:hypothetical protein
MKALDVINHAINRARTLDEEADAIEAYAAVAELVEAARKCCDTNGVYISDLRTALNKFTPPT